MTPYNRETTQTISIDDIADEPGPKLCPMCSTLREFLVPFGWVDICIECYTLTQSTKSSAPSDPYDISNMKDVTHRCLCRMCGQCEVCVKYELKWVGPCPSGPCEFCVG
jgi:hypothetical protein